MASGQVEPEDLVHVLSPKHRPEDELRAVCNSTGQEDAFYLCDVDDIVRKMALWRRLLPRVRPHYAVKCNSSRVVLNTLAALGAGFDCASKGEIEEVLSLGVDPGRIIFAQPTKPAGHIRYAAGRGLDLATFDNEEELYKIRALHPKCRLVLRIRSDAENAKFCLGVKFGCDAVREAPRLLRTARDLGLQVVGVSFHVGSGCREEEAYSRAIRTARHVFDVAAGLGIQSMKLLDIGGGYPGERDDEPVILKMADAINTSLAAHFPSADVDVISEPGLYFVASAFTLAANVHSKREVRNDFGDLEGVMYYINDGVYGSFFDTLLQRHFVGRPLQDPGDAPLVRSSVWGPTCDGVDKLEEDVLLPLLELGSWMVYRSMGAYTIALCGTFNGVPVPKVHAVASAETWLLLKERAPFTDAHFTPSLASGRRHTSASLVEPPRRLGLSLQLQAPTQAGDAMDTFYPPDLCRRGSLLDQADLAGSRPVF